MREEDDKGYFKRYALTSNGVFPDLSPVLKEVFIITGVEHTEEANLVNLKQIDNNKMENECVKLLLLIEQ